MLAQRLIHRIEIQAKTVTTDASTGERTETWSTFELDCNTKLDRVPAEVLLGPGREYRADGAPQFDIAARINIAWIPGITEAMRVLWDGRTFDIHSLEYDRLGREEIRMKCTEGPNRGG